MSLLRCLCVCALLVVSSALGAPIDAIEPDPDEVVATELLPRAIKQSMRRLAATAHPSDAGARLRTARALIEAGRASGDPRTLGYAEALLAVWPPDARNTPVEALVLHATIAQSRHAFERAIALLDRVLAQPSATAQDLAQARLTRATIHQVTGHLEAARADCDGLLGVAREAAAICAAGVDLLSGRTEAALAALRSAVPRTHGAVRAWGLSTLAQAHELRGESATAAGAHRAALAVRDDHNTRLAYADHLLEGEDAAAAAAALRDMPPTDAVLLRRWRSALKLGAGEAELRAQLQDRLTQARRRADRSDLLHARDWAQFALDRGEPAEALRLAAANWQSQREPADLLVLARAAATAGDAATLRDVRAWVAQTKLQDVRLAAVLQEDKR